MIFVFSPQQNLLRPYQSNLIYDLQRYFELMSESKLVDGQTGQLIGNYYSSGNYGNTATSGYVPASSTYEYGSSSGADKTLNYTTQPTYQSGFATPNYQAGYSASGGNYNPSGANYAAGGVTSGSRTQAASGQQIAGGQVVGTTVNTGKEVIKGESRIQYVPFEKTIIQYKDQARVQRVPKKVKKIEYKEERKIEKIPKEVTVTDYYAIEYLRQYIPQIVPEKIIEYVQVPKKQIRYEYIPVERQIVHYPDQSLEAERRVSGSQVAGQTVQGAQGAQGAQGTQGGYATGYGTGQSGTSNAQTGFATRGQTSTTGQTTYTTGGPSYSTEKIYSGPNVYKTGPSQTSNEYSNAPQSNTYVGQQGQRWKSSVPYDAERGTYENVSNPEGNASQKR